jgi:helix-turn-helix protein
MAMTAPPSTVTFEEIDEMSAKKFLGAARVNINEARRRLIDCLKENGIPREAHHGGSCS